MARKIRTRKSRTTRIMTAVCIILFIALTATIFFGERLQRDRQNRLINGKNATIQNL